MRIGTRHHTQERLRRRPTRSLSVLLAAACSLAAAAGAPAPAHAEFKLCNDTASRIGVAIGYRDKDGAPASEGWWTIASQTCEVLLRGGIPSRLIYVRAIDYDQGGGWSGTTQMCTRQDIFAVSGVRDCKANGYQSEGFMEVDTGGSKQWTIRLSDPEKQGETGQ
ncbi:MAG: hypothetical protein APF80_03375 [Alphaproteobacteria bacterium BRH_c36]|nr:MAG: hypothetical protein APF80_03375 [Alphaproteobacteria bacterium BRH_c36]